MIKFFLKIFCLLQLILFTNCSNTEKSKPSVNLNSVHAKNSNEDNNINLYKKNQKGVLGRINNENSNPLSFLREEILGNDFVYLDKSSPEFSTKECLYLYLKKESDNYKLYLKVRYVNDEWIDLQNIIFTVDNVDFTFKGKSIKTETKGKKNYKIELFEIPISLEKDIAAFEKISTSKDVLALLIGKDTYKKYEITLEQQVAMNNILRAYYYFSSKK